MWQTIPAIYENGVFRPIEPLSLADGTSVDLIVDAPSHRTPSLEEQEYVRRVKATQSLDELLAVMPAAVPLPPGYDLPRALNSNREATGERLLSPKATEGTAR